MRVLLGMPIGLSVHPDSATAFHHPVSKESKLKVTLCQAASIAVIVNHNVLWARVMDAYEAGDIDAFAMIHADIGVAPEFLDRLYEEMVSSGADVIGAVIRIKNDTGLMSTAVDDTGDEWLARRLTMREVAKLPKTFGDEEVGGPLLLNTGLWMVKLGPWCLNTNHLGESDFLFDMRHRIKRDTDGKWCAAMFPDDWYLSRKFRDVGLTLKATTALHVLHFDGNTAYPNFGEPVGWVEDIQNGPNAPWRIAQTRGFPHDTKLSGMKVTTPDGEKTIRTAKMEGVETWLVFDDDSKALMKDCRPAETLELLELEHAAS